MAQPVELVHILAVLAAILTQDEHNEEFAEFQLLLNSNWQMRVALLLREVFMVRATVIIGVKKPGNLPVLQAIEKCIERVRVWASSQPGMDNRITIITDTDGDAVPVTAVRDAVKAYVDLGTIDQLIVYFAGHGVNVKYNEFWLLTDAPNDPNAAVNVGGSIRLARYCGIPHVILISDACRTAADSIQAQAVEGSLIFPNTGPNAQPGCVDIFYASCVGYPALEVQDVNVASKCFEAVYTKELVNGLSGSVSTLVQPDTTAAAGMGHVHPWPLERYLRSAVPKLLQNSGVPIGTSQNPDAIITSEPEAWLAEVALASQPDPGSILGVKTFGLITTEGSCGSGMDNEPREPHAKKEQTSPPQEVSLRSAVQSLVSDMLRKGWLSEKELERVSKLPGGEYFATIAHTTTLMEEIAAFKHPCGFRLNGTKVVSSLAATGGCEVLSDGHQVRIDVNDSPTNVLLVFEDGRGALLPAIPDFVGSIDYFNGELVNVSYEPSQCGSRFESAQFFADLRGMRGVIASAAHLFGSFRLENAKDGSSLLKLIHNPNILSVDPTLALYAGYALHELQRLEDIKNLESAQQNALGVSLFDNSLLALEPRERPALMPSNIFPAVPMLSQGWTLLAAYGVFLPRRLQNIYRQVTDSFWTLFDAAGVEEVRAAINEKELL